MLEVGVSCGCISLSVLGLLLFQAAERCLNMNVYMNVVHVKTSTMRSPLIGEVQPWPVPAASDGCCARCYQSRAPALLVALGRMASAGPSVRRTHGTINGKTVAQI